MKEHPKTGTGNLSNMNLWLLVGVFQANIGLFIESTMRLWMLIVWTIK